MADEASIGFRMGPTTEEFYQYWEEEVASGKAVAHAKYRPERKSAAGAGMAVPPEVTIIISEIADLLQSDLVKEAVAAAGGAIGAGVGKFVWAKLLGFLERPQVKRPPDKIVVVVDRREILIFPRSMPSDPPKEFLDAIG